MLMSHISLAAPFNVVVGSYQHTVNVYHEVWVTIQPWHDILLLRTLRGT